MEDRTETESPRVRTAGDTLSQQAYSLIRDRILRGDFPLGAELSRRRLGAEFKMSILPVSAALQRLENEGLVESRPRVGTRVKVPTPQDIRGNYIVREALETQAARLFSERAQPQERLELEQLATDLDARWAGMAEGDGNLEDRVFEVYQHHMRFHMRIAEGTGCPALCQAIEKNHVLVLMTLYDIALGEPTAPSPRWHGELAEVLAGSDIERSDAAMRKHVRVGLEELLRKLEPHLMWDESRLSGLRNARSAANSDRS